MGVGKKGSVQKEMSDFFYYIQYKADIAII